MRALVITYHGIERVPSPLCVEPELFASHLRVLRACGAETVTISQLADALWGRRELPDRPVALTFDDGFRSVASNAAPLLAEHGMRATVFCVAGRLGSDNGWESQPRSVPRMPLANAEEIAALVKQGFEVGSHGMQHAPLGLCSPDELEREVVDSRGELERALGVAAQTFACPYGSSPGPLAARLIRDTYSSACSARLEIVREGTDRYAIPRVDAHYLRNPAILRRVLVGTLDPYLTARRTVATARRVFRSDHSRVRAATPSSGA